LIKIGSLPPHKTLDEFLNRSTPSLDSLSTSHVVLRSTHDPINSPNADPRSTHDLRQSATYAFRITRWSHDEPGMLWYHLLCADQQTLWETLKPQMQ